ncbi:hypothetical protein [Mesorhizobium sp. IMUNJ 23232]|uniref:hypothetical protein n=1 Tax=Mesorhizobium sp. IMUNJ 23232 TaxID=3376064 RepID=UPI00378D2E67
MSVALPDLDLSRLDIMDLGTLWRQLHEISLPLQRIVDEDPCTKARPDELLSDLTAVGVSLDEIWVWLHKQRWRIPDEMRGRNPSDASEREDRNMVLLSAAVEGGEFPEGVAALAATLANEAAAARRKQVRA